MLYIMNFRLRLTSWLLGLSVLIGGVAAPAQGQCDPQQLAKLIASDAAESDRLGLSVSTSGDTTVVGAYLDDHAGGFNAGSAYVFVRSGPRGCEVWTQQAKLTAFDAAGNDQFGSSVAVSGNTVVVGAHLDDNAGGSNAGSAYVFVRSGPPGSEVWTQQAKLTASDAAAGDFFGYSIAVGVDTAVVGAYFDDHAGGTDAGSAYIFARSGTLWTQQAKLTASDQAASDFFGYSVAVSDNTAVVGAILDDHPGGTDAGSAYVFVRSGPPGSEVWTEQAKLTASDAATFDGFGDSVALSTDTAVVGAWLDDHAGGLNAGSTYVFVRSGTVWTEQAKLTASDAAADDRFGQSVAVSGDRAVVGAYLDDHDAGGTDAGSAYVFARSGTLWTQQQKLTASDAAGGDNFGWSVAMRGDRAVVGAHFDDHAGGTDAGAAYLFDVECESTCPADIAPTGGGDGSVNVDDLLAIINAWGTCK